MEADISLRFSIISFGKIHEIDYFKVLKTYYTETAVKSISFNLTHRRLGYINEKLIKQLANERVTGLKLKPKSAGRHNRYNDYMVGQIKAIPHSYR